MPTLKRNECTWLIVPSQCVGGRFLPAEYCGAKKNPKAKNPNYADEATEYESFCPQHMATWQQLRKNKASNEVNEDIDFDV